MNTQTINSNPTAKSGTMSNLTEFDVKKILSKCIADNIVNSLIEIAKESPIGISTDISSALILQYSKESNLFTVIIGRNC